VLLSPSFSRHALNQKPDEIAAIVLQAVSSATG
jgi:hypothetical protein